VITVCLRCLAVLAWIVAAPAFASHTVTFKIATIAPDGTTWMLEMREGAERIARRTDGRVKFRFYPGGVMGNDKSVLRKLRIGQLQGGAITGGGLALIDPTTTIYSLPFTFRSEGEIDYARARMDPVLIESLEHAGFVTLGFVEGGFAYLMSSAPLRAMEDLRGREVWIPEGDRISRAVFEDMSVSPIPLPLPDVLTGLQTGLVDTVGASAIGAIALQWHTRVKYLTDTPLVYLYGALLIDRRAFSKLDEKDRIVVLEVMSGMATRLKRQTRDDDRKARHVLRNQGITFVTPSREAVMRLHKSVARTADRLAKEGVVPASLLERLRAHLDDYRRTAGATP
jgi:TRAP-type C4-dicarboxylate transport system substrate-binding protein